MIALLTNPVVALIFYGATLAFVCALSWVSRCHVLRENAAWLALDWAAGNAILAVAGTEHAPALMGALDLSVCVGLYQNAQKNLPAHHIVRLYVFGLSLTFFAYATHLEGTWVQLSAMNIVFLFQMFTQGRASCVRLADRARDVGRYAGPWTDAAAVIAAAAARKA